MTSLRMTRAAAIAARLMAILAIISVCPIAATASAVDVALPSDAANLVQPGDLCKRGYTDYYWTLEDEFSGNQSYTVFCGQVECCDCSGGWKPISVTMYLYWEEKNSCRLTVQAEIREAKQVGSAGPVPGGLVTRSKPTIVGPFKPAGLWAVTVALPRDCPTVAGPCFATLQFLDTCEELPAVVAGPAACEAMTTWVDSGDGPVDLAACGFPGNPNVYATFECQIPNAEQPVAWSTIKGRYAE
ncbi:MAG: hypothetical protein JXB46_00310 [Candidatus Eisenbacteria bacterium]|nr:hypothetical protein [Candidatus Eisenbacteria bacterium]